MRTRVTGFLLKKTEKNQVPRKIFVSTCGDSVVSSYTEADLNSISGCTHEEADARVFLHATDCVKEEHKKIIIRTADIDIVVLVISVVEDGRAVGCIWDWKTFYIHCHPRD